MDASFNISAINGRQQYDLLAGTPEPKSVLLLISALALSAIVLRSSAKAKIRGFLNS